MKVILKQEVTDLGRVGDVVDVADGYARNYLLRAGMAMRATTGAVADAEALRAARVKREERDRQEAEELKANLEATSVTVGAKAGPDGTLYGSVGNGKIADALREQRGVSVSRKQIPLERPLKSLGEHDVAVKLHSEVEATIRVEVERES
ncbi:MAG: 50S ribosomal protein L9 [Actinobacteria bacterium QS_5_72_10]|jgi:large subunit ribosomal protein L9|nr:MAG: 50S ribosomal protein L9 [Actinobacteria bacterium QS_8_72_14]PSO53687.1 MAG: 50S ribosomal protein L9 [Actinobacteria bacterium QS_5_72_10]